MLEKRQLNQDYLEFLIENKIIESADLEYKRDLPGYKDSEKKDFFKDVASMANAHGGVILFGIEQQDGYPISVRGLDIQNMDAERNRFEQSINAVIEPRIPNFNIDFVPLSNGHVVMALSIERSWLGPHWVNFDKSRSFWVRGLGGKREMDWRELKVAFLQNEQQIERIRKFRKNRIEKLLERNTVFIINSGALVVLHLIPLGVFEDFMYINFKDQNLQHKFEPLSASAYNRRYNFDGYVTYRLGDKGQCMYYTQLYRTGVLEAVDTMMLMPIDSDTHPTIPNIAFERVIVSAVSKYLDGFKTLGIRGSIMGSLTLMGVKGYGMPRDNRFRFERHYIDRDVLELPEVLFDNESTDPYRIVQPWFDSLWNACGYERCLNYDENANYLYKE